MKKRIFGREKAANVHAPKQLFARTDPEAAKPAQAKHNRLDTETIWKRKIHDRLLKILDFSLITSLDETSARRQIGEVAMQVIEQQSVPLSAAVRQRLAKEIEDEILGLGPLEPLMYDPAVSDILVNGCHSVYVERHGRLEKVDIQFRDDSHLMRIIERIVSQVGRRIDESSPMVDARLADGSRVNAIIPPLALDGPLLSIRRFGIIPIDMEKLIELGSITPMIAEVLKAIVRARLNVLISGGTGTGKTTMLNAVSAFIPVTERIVSIEDSAELRLQQPHVARLETRPANIEGSGSVTQRDLLRNALRMRPDRIIVGEVRGSEALDMLQAMNTGHDGSLTTVHANTPRDALARIENMVAMAGLEMPISATRSQIVSGIDVVIQIERMEDGRRRLVSLQEIQGMEGEIVTMAEIFTYRRRGIDADGKVLGQFMATGVVPNFRDHLAARGVELDDDSFNPDRITE